MNDCKWYGVGCRVAAMVLTLGAAGLAQAANDYIVAPSGGDITGAALSAQLAQGNVTLQSSQGKQVGSGNVIVNDTVSWNTGSTLTLIASNNVQINANVVASGNATLTISPNTANGNEQPSGQGAYGLAGGASITLSGATPALSIAGASYTVINQLGTAADATTAPVTPTLQGMAAAANLTGRFALGSDIDAGPASAWNGGQGFSPIGTETGKFTGNLEGLGHAVRNLGINRPSASNVGLFGYTWQGFAVRNLRLLNVGVSGGNGVGGLAGTNAGAVGNVLVTGNVGGGSYVGLLAGYNLGPVRAAFAKGNVSGNTGVGGLVGNHTTVNGIGRISGSCAMVAVSGTGSEQTLIGGLVGDNNGAIDTSCATGSVSASTDNNNGSAWVGGLVGRNGNGDNTDGSIDNCYATGSVQGWTYVGGLVGGSNSVNAISNSYAMGSVAGQLSVGGLVGYYKYMWPLTANNSYWNTTTSGQANSAGGGTGLTSAQMTSAANFAGFAFTATPGAAGWVIVDTDGSFNNAAGAAGAAFPMLATEYSTLIFNARQLQLMQLAPAAGYALADDIDAAATGGSGDVWGSSGFVPVGTFTGTFDGRGHVIRKLTINRPAASYTGLFGTVGANAVVGNVGLSGGSVSGNVNVGGLVGYLNGGTLSNSYYAGNVIGAGNAVGGLVGASTGSIGGSYATGSVRSPGSDVGGLVGNNSTNSRIANCYATNSVSGGPVNVGGLVGGNYVGASIVGSYAAGSVTGTGNTVGGLVGGNLGNVGNSYWNITSSGQSISAGGGGLSSEQMQTVKSFLGFDFTTPVWVIVDGDGTLNNANGAEGATYPVLAGEYATSIGNAHQLQLMAMNPAAAYTLNADVDAGGTAGVGDVWGKAGFAPVGGYSVPFSGRFDGQGHGIVNLTIAQRKVNRAGLFGVIGTAATVRNTALNGGAVNGFGSSGALAGINNGSVTNCSSSVAVKSSRGGFYGGLIGSNNGTVGASQASGNVSGTGGFGGGLVGMNGGTVSSCSATGTVNVQNGYSGPLVGYNNGTIN